MLEETMEDKIQQEKLIGEKIFEEKDLNVSINPDAEQKLPQEVYEISNLDLTTEEDEENKKKNKNEEESKENKQHGNYSTPAIDTQVLYELYKQRNTPNYSQVEVVLYSYQVPWFATAMTDGNKIWFGPRMEFYDPHPNDRLYHELSHWRISTPYGTELDVETMAQMQLPRVNSLSISYKI